MLYQDSKLKNVLIMAESRNGAIDTLALQLASKGRELADKLGCQLNVIVLGHQLDSPMKQLLDKGFDNVFVADHPMFESYNAEV